MSKAFAYSIDQTKDCIIETEQQLRDLISTVLSRKYGLDWEHSSPVWDDEKRKTLSSLLQQEQGRHPYQTVSQRLLDYTYIVDLKDIIDRYWDLFSNVFQSKEKVMHRFTDLMVLRNPEMHGRPDILPFQKHLCLGVCGEILAAIDHWSLGYDHSIKEYSVGFKFAVYIEGENEGTAQETAKSFAQQWLADVCHELGGKLEQKSIDEDKPTWLLSVGHNHVKITMTWRYKGFDGRYFRAADIEVKTSNAATLGKVVEAGRSPYWFLCWTLKDDLSPSIVASTVLERTGKRPVSSTEIRTGDTRLLTNADFRLGEASDENIRVTLSRWNPDTNATICLSYDGSPSKGFYRTHEVFSVKNVLSILYGELPYWKVEQLVKEACTHEQRV